MEEQIRILLVDDEINVLRSLERTFLDDSYEILTASSAAEGLAVLRGTAPVQLVISDYRMPEMSGVEFLREVCRQWPDTVRIVLSGYADTGVVIAAINEGEIYKFIPKPWNDDELKVTVKNALERYPLNKKNMELTEALLTKVRELSEANAELELLTGRHRCRGGAFSSARAESILQALPVGIIIADGSGTISLCNGEAAELISCDATACVGSRLNNALPEEVVGFISLVKKQKPETGLFSLNGVTVQITCCLLQDEGHAVTTLILDRGV